MYYTTKQIINPELFHSNICYNESGEYMKENKRLKIGLFIDTFFPAIDGVVIAVDNLAKMLAKNNDVTVIAPKTSTYNEDYKKPYEIIRINSIHVPFTEYQLGIKQNRIFKKLLNKKFDIIHIHSPFTIGKIGVELAKKQNIPCVGTIHTRFEFEVERVINNKTIINTFMKKVMKVYNNCDECIAVNDPIIEDIKKYGYKNKTTVILNGADLTPIDPKDSNIERINKLYNLKKNDLVLIYVGRIISFKNIYFILDALKKLKDENIKFKMLYIGTGPDYQKLENKIKHYNMDDCVILTGRINERSILASIYKRADLLLFPSLMDTSSLVRIEASTQETPGLFIKNSMVGQTINNNFNGYTSEYDIDCYKERIKEIISNKNKLKKVGKNAKETIGKSWKDIAEETYNEYLKLIEKR